jgi:lysophospholipase L1-like esterase
MKKTLLIVITTLIGISSYAQDWAKFSRYEAANDTVKVRPRAVFMGDSITDNWAKKDMDFFTSNNFVGRGISGQTTSHMLVRFRRDVVDLNPKYVVIMAGTNDIALNNGEISHENILGNIISMCEIAKANKIKPILCSVLPADRFRWRPQLTPAEDLVKLNKMIQEYAKSARIPYVDYHSVLKDENNALPEKHAADGVHPNLDCYKIMEEIIVKYL